MKPPPGLLRLSCLAALLLGGCHPGVLNPAGPVGAGQRTILLNSLAIMLAIVVPTIIATLVFAWWFRAGNTRATYRPNWSYSGRLELLVWSVPALIVIFLAGITWIGSHDLDPRKPLVADQPPLVVEVVSLDWKWLFIYPEQGMASVNRMVIPAGRPIKFRITSGTVMNSFFVPRLGSQIYAMSGMETTLFLQADQPGRYRGISAHYSGPGFADMRFVVDSVRPAEFTSWATRAKASNGPVLDGPGFLALAKRTEVSPVVTYRAAQPRLFEAIIMQSGAPVHETQSGGRDERR